MAGEVQVQAYKLPVTIPPVSPLHRAFDYPDNEDDHPCIDGLIPRHQVDLLYADGISPGASITSKVFTLIAMIDLVSEAPEYYRTSLYHHSRSYVVVESFEQLLSSVTCSEGRRANSTSIFLTFKSHHLMRLAYESWLQSGELNFITQHDTCNDEFDRSIYRSFSVFFDATTLTAIVEGNLLTIALSPDAATSTEFSGGLSPPHISKIIKENGFRGAHLVKRDAVMENTFSIAIDKTFGDTEHLGIKMSGEIAASFHLKLRDDINIGETIAHLAGNVPKENWVGILFQTAILKLEVTRPIDVLLDLDFSILNGGFFRIPGLFVGKDPRWVDKFSKQRFIPIWKGGPFNLSQWAGWGFMLLATLDITLDIKGHIAAQLPASQYMQIDLINLENTINEFHPTKYENTFKTETAEALGCFAMSYGGASDLGLALSVPDGPEFWEIYAGFQLDMADVDSSCNTNTKGPITKGTKEEIDLFFGVSGYCSWATYLKPLPIPRIHGFPGGLPFPLKLPKDWWRAVPIQQHCWGDETPYAPGEPERIPSSPGVKPEDIPRTAERPPDSLDQQNKPPESVTNFGPGSQALAGESNKNNNQGTGDSQANSNAGAGNIPPPLPLSQGLPANPPPSIAELPNENNNPPNDIQPHPPVPSPYIPPSAKYLAPQISPPASPPPNSDSNQKLGLPKADGSLVISSNNLPEQLNGQDAQPVNQGSQPSTSVVSPSVAPSPNENEIFRGDQPISASVLPNSEAAGQTLPNTQ
ncbi:MAG: hypothetical protein M1829_006183 [Trizodia sp. TS-e1964]|nr:MAG: hypothetical protein M1829_006183 [Trizodia sp. TS-e1964]